MKDRDLRARTDSIEVRLKALEDKMTDWEAKVRSANGRFYRAMRKNEGDDKVADQAAAVAESYFAKPASPQDARSML
ncbi:MAG: hypothetical protein ABR585_14245 [Gemmatimonadaceae bacterium]